MSCKSMSPDMVKSGTLKACENNLKLRQMSAPGHQRWFGYACVMWATLPIADQVSKRSFGRSGP
jgi:hypothetical protein